MRNSKQTAQELKTYIIASIEDPDNFSWDESKEEYTPNPFNTDKEALDFFWTRFKSEYGHRIDQVGNRQALTDYLQGLPSTINIPWMNHDILIKAAQWGLIHTNPTEKQEDKLLEGYWSFMSSVLLQLVSSHGVM